MLDFLKSDSIWVYFIIFFGKVTEVTFTTLRNVLINRGERTKGALVALVEVILWIYVTGTALAGFRNSPLKVAVFAVAFALGNYLGSWLENKIALGLSTIEVIATEEPTRLLEALRAHNLGVTVLDGEGKDGPRKILKVHLKRSRIAPTVRLISKNLDNCVISVSDVRVVKGGYIRKLNKEKQKEKVDISEN
ncbi:MAG TPA: DUF5698 domain-containing protein [Clostridia bacterium]|nr:DUF5698 domain-containing protein [Clostridia bacterium]HOL61590.1 DUF5698 domain-containing protein [Clostridia bacterium]HPO54208.1 DUF5698 domain-containing protein [Clostridia bacterium]